MRGQKKNPVEKRHQIFCTEEQKQKKKYAAKMETCRSLNHNKINKTVVYVLHTHNFFFLTLFLSAPILQVFLPILLHN